MFSQDLVNQLAADLNQSEKSRVQIEHFSKRFPNMTMPTTGRWVGLSSSSSETLFAELPNCPIAQLPGHLIAP